MGQAGARVRLSGTGLAPNLPAHPGSIKRVKGDPLRMPLLMGWKNVQAGTAPGVWWGGY